MDQAITRAAGAAPRAVGEFQGYVDGVDGIKPSVRWLDRKNMPQVGDRLFAIPARAAVPRSWAVLLTSENHGTVGPVGCTFPWAGEKHERIQVMEIVEAGSPPAPGVDLGGLVRLNAADILPGSVAASTVLTDERIYDIAATSEFGIGNDDDEMAERMAFARAIEREVAAQAGQVAATEELTRFCPACGSVGDVGPDYRDCCPDGSEARRIPKSLAEKCHELFKAALDAMLDAAPAAPAQAKPLPAVEVPAPAAPKQCWSLNDEGFSHDSLSELLDNYPDLKAGAQVFTGMGVYPALSRLIDSDDVIDQMGDRAYDIAGEYADGYPNVSVEDKAELDALLEGWIKKACSPDFYEVRDVHTYVITEQDIAAQASTAGGRQEDGAA